MAHACFHGAIEKLKTVSLVSGNLRKDLKQSILSAIEDLTKSYNEIKEESERLKQELHKSKITEVSFASVVKATPHAKVKSFKAVISARDPRKDASKLLKEKIDPVSLGVGVKMFKKTQTGNVIIETEREEDLNLLCKEVQSKCQPDLNTKIQAKLNPRVIIFNVPEEINIQNVKEIARQQNPNLITEQSTFVPKYLGITKIKKTRYIIVEVDAALRKLILNTKLKLMWNLCNARDNISVPRCFRCSRFHGNFKDCKESVTCPICADTHPLKECTAEASKYKCINCVNHNNQVRGGKRVDTTHSSLSKHCPTYHKIIKSIEASINYGE